MTRFVHRLSTSSLSFIFFSLAIWSSEKCDGRLTDQEEIRVWNGRIVYYTGRGVKKDLWGAEKMCTDLGGHLPDIHSVQDIIDLTLHNEFAPFWTRARESDTNRSVYVWKSGIPVDKKLIKNDTCLDRCCGLTIDLFSVGFDKKSCAEKNRVICFLPILTNEVANLWYQLQVNFHRSFNVNDETAIEYIKERFSVDTLNATLIDLQVKSSPFYSGPSKLDSRFIGMLRLWRGKLVYFNKQIEDLNETREICKKLEGNLLSVHSKKDLDEINKLTLIDHGLWLGAEEDASSKGPNATKYKWSDGTPFDYDQVGNNSCGHSCCGLSVSKYNQELSVQDCRTRNYMACLSNTTKKWHNFTALPDPIEVRSTGSLPTDQRCTLSPFKRMLIKGYRDKMKQNLRQIESKYDKLTNYIRRMFKLINSALVDYRNQMRNLTKEILTLDELAHDQYAEFLDDDNTPPNSTQTKNREKEKYFSSETFRQNCTFRVPT